MKTMKLAALGTTDEIWLLLVSDSRVICEEGGTTTCETGGKVCEAGGTTYGTEEHGTGLVLKRLHAGVQEWINFRFLAIEIEN